MKANSSFAPRTGEIYIHTALRGLAALSVVGYHAMLGATGKGYSDNLLQNFFLSSFMFVDLFFMLSGFIMNESYGEKILLNNNIQNSTRYLVITHPLR